MTLNTLGKQWASIVSEFEGSEQAQRKCNAELAKIGYEVDDYNAGRLRVLELGLFYAKEYHRSFRFKFWLKPVISTNQILVSFLLSLQEQVELDEPGDTGYRTGMMDALENWIDWISMTDAEAGAVRNWMRIPGTAG